ncbi:MAG TPA: hypothetical protein VE046_13705 [Steroidobacteraceae bacterium]|nr:hypothetical protein [Steroidobacteraceae bacterium]
MSAADPLADTLPNLELGARHHTELSAVRFSLLAVIARVTTTPNSHVDSVAALARNLERAVVVLSNPNPVESARRWLTESARAWATLDVLFADTKGRDERAGRCAWRGVTGQLQSELRRVLEIEYAHLLAGGGSVKQATERLRRDCNDLSIDVAAADALRRALGDADIDEKQDWFGTYLQQCFALAEYMHRNVLGLNQILSDHEAMRCATAMSGAVRVRAP